MAAIGHILATAHGRKHLADMCKGAAIGAFLAFLFMWFTN